VADSGKAYGLYVKKPSAGSFESQYTAYFEPIVGIGTTTPSAILDIVGTLGDNVTDLFNVSSTTDTDIVSSLFKIKANGDMQVDTDTLYVDATNNRVGIGLVNPSELLDISGSNVPTVKIKSTTGGDASSLVLGNPAYTNRLFSESSS
jgi:hypothetical protein